jgi:hypothetical protein
VEQLMTDLELEQLWNDFGNTPIFDDDTIEEPFLHFPTGTDRFDIWHWFDDRHSKGIIFLVMNEV